MTLRMYVVVYEPMDEFDTIEDAEDRVLDKIERTGMKVVSYGDVVVVD